MALSPASHSRCFAALMTYIAGMVCFSCKPDWARSVQWKMGEVIRVRIADTACTELWACCAGPRLGSVAVPVSGNGYSF